jgi:hypothetical protein
MKQVTTVAALALLLVLAVPMTADAQGTVRLSWDNCDPYVQNLNTADVPGDAIVKQVLSITGEDRPNFGHLTFLRVGPNTPDAWRFDADGCPSDFDPTLLSASTDAVNAFTCPAFKSSDEGPGFAVTYDPSNQILSVELSQVYVTQFTPVATNRYTMWQISYNLGTSVFFSPGDPEYCPGLDDMVCFGVSPDPQLVLDVGVFGPLTLSEGFVTWNDAANSQGCPTPVPTDEESTWGAIKGMYR